MLLLKGMFVAEIKKAFHETVAEKLIEQLRAGTAPWQKPWSAGEPGAVLPFNATTGKRYRGINAVYLMAQGHADQRWLTYKQAAAIDAQVRKGEKGTPIQYWKFSEDQDRLDEQGRPVRDAQDQPVVDQVKLERPRAFFATVFNAEQIEGLPPLQRIERDQTWSPQERAERILLASGVAIEHSSQDRAFYRVLSDSIHLPERSQFASSDRYYAVALHELGHATGHKTRLDRDLANPFGSVAYAKEELRAEIASMILGDDLGIGHDPEQHAAYVGSWITVLENDPMEIMRAAADAEKIQTFILGFDQEQVQTQSEQGVAEVAKPLDLFSTTEGFPGRLVDRLEDRGMSHLDAVLAGAMRDRRHGSPATLEVDRAILAEASQRAFGITLTDSLRGGGTTVLRSDIGGDQNFEVRGHVGDEDWVVLIDNLYFDDAKKISDRLTLIAAHAETDTKRQQHLLAMSRENAVRSDPNSTDEEKTAAKESRKIAEGILLTADRATSERTVLIVPFKEKEQVKALGAKWDREGRTWYAPAGLDPQPFAKWAHGPDESAREQVAAAPVQHQSLNSENAVSSRQFLAVPYEDRVMARQAGAAWDTVAKSWYVGPAADPAQIARWSPDSAQAEQGPAMDPRDEFAEALAQLGCTVDGAHPIMDGNKHRIAVEGDRKGEHAGFYVGHLDGHPAGYIKNNKTGEELKWKSKGYTLDPEQKAQLHAESAQKLAERAIEQASLHARTAARLVDQLDTLRIVDSAEPTPYMVSKGIQVQFGAFTDRDGRTTFIPAIDADNKLWTMQYIQEDGTKRFAKDSRKEGCFHAIGGLDALAAAPVIVIAEGYATAATLAEVLGHSTVAGFDSGNLPAVALALQARFPDKPIIIAGDDDHQQEAISGINPGRSKMEEAAQAVNGTKLLPIFSTSERAANPKGFTDFNDLATKSVLGRDGVERQVRFAVDGAIARHAALVKSPVQVLDDLTHKLKLVHDESEAIAAVKKVRAPRKSRSPAM
jgi:putative DNA primase/helicase